MQDQVVVFRGMMNKKPNELKLITSKQTDETEILTILDFKITHEFHLFIYCIRDG